MSKEIKLEGMREIIAERMSESWHVAPRVVYTLSVDMTNTLAKVKEMNKDLTDKINKVTVNHVLMDACAQAMKEFEFINSSVDAEEGKIIIHDEINIGLAVAVDNGLIVPNIKDIGNKDLRTIAKETNEAVNRTRTMSITMDDITGGTFTISNLGMMNIENFSPIINQPEVCILGVNKVIETPVVENGEIVIRPKMNLNLTADHRVIDGAYAAQYLSKVKEILEA